VHNKAMGTKIAQGHTTAKVGIPDEEFPAHSLTAYSSRSSTLDTERTTVSEMALDSLPTIAHTTVDNVYEKMPD